VSDEILTERHGRVLVHIIPDLHLQRRQGGRDRVRREAQAQMDGHL